MKIELVTLKEAARLWQRDVKTLKKWAREGKILYDIIGDKNSARGIWYVETPSGRYCRIHNI